MDFDPRDFDDSRDRDRHEDRGGPSLGRGPSSRDDDSEVDSGDGDDARWSERDHDTRDRDDTRDPFTRDLNLPHGPDREIVRDRDQEYTLRGAGGRSTGLAAAQSSGVLPGLVDQHMVEVRQRKQDENKAGVRQTDDRSEERVDHQWSL